MKVKIGVLQTLRCCQNKHAVRATNSVRFLAANKVTRNKAILDKLTTTYILLIYHIHIYMSLNTAVHMCVAHEKIEVVKYVCAEQVPSASLCVCVGN